MAATSVLASITLMVAHLAWMDLEMTDLVPVLKSYWLTIHVSIITASYGFFALGALLGFLNLIFNLFKTNANVLKIDERIEELTLYQRNDADHRIIYVTIGTFLGGIWANESWGRYWGWDQGNVVLVPVAGLCLYRSHAYDARTEKSLCF
ncbi:MAG: cytochrome c biogenesis protein CcsA [Bacteroidales bacterium]|nr:cytochrome c biogenesis protein CcsA [Bacteroidales bacterium]